MVLINFVIVFYGWLCESLLVSWQCNKDKTYERGLFIKAQQKHL